MKRLWPLLMPCLNILIFGSYAKTMSGFHVKQVCTNKPV